MCNGFFYSKSPVIPGNQTYLERTHLYQLLGKAVQSPIVLVVAGAGFGKTHAVYSFLQHYTAVSIWIQLSERDNLGTRFWENFVQAVGFIGKEPATKLGESRFPETQGQFDRYLAIVRETIYPEKKYVLVYDDFDLLHDTSVLRFMERSMHRVFPNITSVLISRNEPEMHIEDLISKGLLAKITEADLRFSQQEMLDYFHIQDIGLSEEEAAVVYHDTEGWAFAIHLAGLSLKKGAPTVDYARSSMKLNIFRLIEYEVFSSISPDLQKYLIKLSLIEHWSQELLAELADTQDLIEQMKRIGSFIQYNASWNAFKIHQLFLQFLSSRQDRLCLEERQEVYNKAAQWCIANNLKMDAITYYEKAGNYHALIAVIRQFPQTLSQAMAEFFLGFFNRMPDQIFDAMPTAYILYTRFLLSAGRFEQAAASITEIIKRFESKPPTSCNSAVLYGCYLNLGYLGFITCIFTSVYDFPRAFEKAYQYYLGSDPTAAESISSTHVDSYLCRVGGPEPGEIEQFINAMVHAAPLISASTKGCMYGYEDLAKGEYAFFKGDMKTSERFVVNGLHKAQEKKQYELETRALFLLLRISVALGNLDQIEDIYRQLKAQLKEALYINRYALYDIVMGWFYTQIGQPGKYDSWLKHDFEEADVHEHLRDLETLIRVRYHVAEKRYPVALASLESWNNRDDPKAFLFGKLELKVLEAVCLYKADDKEKAFSVLSAAYQLAAPNNLDMPFIEMGKAMRTLAGAAMKDKTLAIPQHWLEKILRKSSAYSKKLFMVTEKYREENHQQHARNIRLSPRELETLTGLSQGLTREELALALCLSINTIKSIIKRIYIKLGAINQADAVRIATRLGILKK